MTSAVLAPRRRILLAQLISHGDCLYATAVARQIKHDDPHCHLTWAISERCKSVLNGNPHVDALWEWPAFDNDELPRTWREFQRQAHARKTAGEFDDVYLTQFVPEAGPHWDGNLRSTIFRGYPSPITVPVAPVVWMSDAEVENVRSFAAAHGLPRRDQGPVAGEPPVILFECSPGSLQSFMTPKLALEVAQRLLARFPTLRVVVSSHLPFPATDPRLIDGSRLTFRENAELSHYCTLLVGCSSGLTWLCTSEAARRLPTIQVLTKKVYDANQPVIDHLRLGLATDHILEVFDCSAEHLGRCVETMLEKGFAAARRRFHERPMARHYTYRLVLRILLGRGQYRQAAALFWRNKSTLTSHFVWVWYLHRVVKWLGMKYPRARTGQVTAVR